MVVLPYVPKNKVIWIAIVLFVIDQIVDGRDAEGGIFLWPRLIHFSVFFLVGFVLRDIPSFRGFIKSDKSFIISSILFVLLCVVLTKQVQQLLLGWPILCFIGCWFVWSLGARLCRYEKAVKVLSYVGKNSLGYYWQNGYVLVLVRVLVVTITGVTFGPAVVLTVFVLCAVIETLIIFIIKKMPKVGILIGV